MKMAKASAKDIDAAGDLMSLLDQADRGDYPGDQDGAPDYFDADDRNHLRAFYDAVMETLKKSPGYPGRVIGGMCYVIMWDKNEIIDPASDVLDLHPKLVKALAAAESAAVIPQAAPSEAVAWRWKWANDVLPNDHPRCGWQLETIEPFIHSANAGKITVEALYLLPVAPSAQTGEGEQP